MALLDILVYPDTRLRQKAEPVIHFDESLRKLVNDMTETMYDAPGIGLAAVQVNIPLRVVVMDLSEDRSDLRIFINPTFQVIEGTIEFEEGCLSVPGIYASVERAEKILIQAMDIDGNSFELEAEGLLSVCIQHEIDHLDGKVFVDYLSRMKQDRVKKKLKKDIRQAETETV
ncbi:MAG: peptide deformylase [Gammaproteobacteria bacterium]|nr:peptide deformylase [Gammaproteobacteria bacterium]